MKHFKGVAISIPRLLAFVTVAGVFVVASSQHRDLSLVATTNHPPTGTITGVSCALNSDNATYTYTITAKWADPDATAASGPANAYLGASTSAPNKPSTAIDGKNYDGPSRTWSFTSSTLTDSRWPIKLYVHDYLNPAGNGVWPQLDSRSKPACPQPNPPAPSGNTGGSSNTGSSGTVRRTATTPASPTPAPPSNAADATVTAGTVAVTVKIPADGASRVHINYAANGSQVTSTADQAVSGDGVTTTLLGLSAKTKYTFQIVRTNTAGVSVTSSDASFTTSGFTVVLQFRDKNKKPVSGIATYLVDPSKIQKSDKKGTVTFSDVYPGIYSPTYTYKGQTFSSTIDTSTADTSGTDPTDVSLADTLNVDALLGASSNTNNDSHKGNAGIITVWIIIVLILLTAAWFGWRFWRRKRLETEYAGLGMPAGPGTPDIIDFQTHQATAQPAPVPTPEHMGKSLREMVVESMQQDAAQHPHDGPPPPHVPGR